MRKEETNSSIGGVLLLMGLGALSIIGAVAEAGSAPKLTAEDKISNAKQKLEILNTELGIQAPIQLSAAINAINAKDYYRAVTLLEYVRPRIDTKYSYILSQIIYDLRYI